VSGGDGRVAFGVHCHDLLTDSVLDEGRRGEWVAGILNSASPEVPIFPGCQMISGRIDSGSAQVKERRNNTSDHRRGLRRGV
jgi:hypothetical protein